MCNCLMLVSVEENDQSVYANAILSELPQYRMRPYFKAFKLGFDMFLSLENRQQNYYILEHL
jgi:hypothetical protein